VLECRVSNNFLELDPGNWQDIGPTSVDGASLDLLRNTATLSAPSGAQTIQMVIRARAAC